MKKKTILIIVGVILLLGLIIFLLTKLPKREFNTFTFPSTMVAKDYTKSTMSDTITMVILNKILEYDTMKIEIFPIPSIFKKKDGDIEIIAFISPVPFEKHRYKIYLKKDVSIWQLITVLSHEMVHLKQYEDGRLQVIEGKGYVWEGDTTLYHEVEYKDRPYEKEAFVKEVKIKRQLNKMLFKKKTK